MIETGTNEDALAWLAESSLDDDLEEGWRAFVSGFPALTFFRSTEEGTADIERIDKVRFPDWFRAMRLVMAGFEPQQGRCVRFDGYDHPHSDIETFPDMEFQFGELGSAGGHADSVVEKNRLYAIASADEGAYTTLVINLAAPDDRRVYRFDHTTVDEATGLVDPATTAFDSFGSMLRHISVVSLGDGRTLTRRS